jgi:hypothetical protein
VISKARPAQHSRCPPQVYRLEFPLNDDLGEEDGDTDIIHQAVDEPVAAAKEFLDRHPTAKIVVIIDTHSAENGGFIYEGNSPGNYQMCFMLEVSLIHLPSHSYSSSKIISKCIHASLYPYINDTKKSPVHAHRLLIVNLACGASVKKVMARDHLGQGSVGL